MLCYNSFIASSLTKLLYESGLIMKLFENKKAMTVLRVLPFLVCAGLIAAYYFSGNDFTVEALLEYTPNSLVLTALMMMILYALKSLSIVFPIMVLCVAGGYLFDPIAAIILNLLGMGISLSVSYLFGWFSGKDFIDKLISTHPKLAAINRTQNENDFFVAFFLRIINSLPLDIVSMYLGASGMKYTRYIAASLAGAAPGVIAATVIGTSITDPTSPAFIFSVALTVALAVLSAAVYAIYKHRKNKVNNEIRL